MPKQAATKHIKDFFPAMKWAEIFGASGRRKTDSQAILVSKITLKNTILLT